MAIRDAVLVVLQADSTTGPSTTDR